VDDCCETENGEFKLLYMTNESFKVITISKTKVTKFKKVFKSRSLTITPSLVVYSNYGFIYTHNKEENNKISVLDIKALNIIEDSIS
jgi:hypothetical protein